MELDYDAVEAYEAAINRLDNPIYKNMLSEFTRDHQRHKRHIAEISQLLRKHDVEPPDGPSAKQWLTKGKVMMANMVGDEAILGAMITNEADTNPAYERMNEHESQWPEALDVLQRGLADERRHKAWLENTQIQPKNLKS